jgi:NhaP-type Na+/H+ or K+/H+ antiporter
MDIAYKIAAVNLFAGWCGFLAGVISGAVIGMFFHRDDWMGGYDSYRRRMVRLGHISFFGLGFLNVLFGLTLGMAHFPEQWLPAASWCLLAGAVTMPVCCFLSAWRKPFRHLFFMPVSSLFTGIAIILLTWRHL